MKKLFCWALICFIAVISCDLQLPKSVTIKGQPRLYVPLKEIDVGAMLGDSLDPDRIKAMMDSGSGGNGIQFYDYINYDPSSNIQAYLAHYPITKIDLDFDSHIEEATANNSNIVYDIPAITEIQVHVPGYTSGELYFTSDGIQSAPNYTDPTFTLTLMDNINLVKSIDGRFGFRVNRDIGQHLKIYIPGFGFSDYVEGISENSSDPESDLIFIKDGTDPDAVYTIIPASDIAGGILKIYIGMKDYHTGRIEPELVFDWTSAVVDTTDLSEYADEYDVDLNLAGILGEGIEFKKVNGYIYIDGFDQGDEATLSLDLEVAGGAPQSLVAGSLTSRTMPVLSDQFNGSLLPHSVSGTEPIDLTGMLNAGASSKIRYNMEVDTLTVHAHEPARKFTVDMVIVIPLEFLVSGDSPVDGYVKLDINELNSLFPESGDIFSRTGGEDDLFNNIESVRLLFLNVTRENNFFDLNKLAVLIENNSSSYRGFIDFSDDIPVPFLDINMAAIPSFSPKVNILLKKDNPSAPGGKATYAIKRQDEGAVSFCFFLAVEAQADINYTHNF